MYSSAGWEMASTASGDSGFADLMGIALGRRVEPWAPNLLAAR